MCRYFDQLKITVSAQVLHVKLMFYTEKGESR